MELTCRDKDTLAAPGCWTYEQVADQWDVLMDMYDESACDKTAKHLPATVICDNGTTYPSSDRCVNDWTAMRELLADLFARAGWTEDLWDAVLDARLDAKDAEREEARTIDVQANVPEFAFALDA